jgi:hypothetical protein
VKGHFNNGKKITNVEVTSQEICPTAESLMNKDGVRTIFAIHCPLGLKFQLLEKANAIAECVEKQFTPHDLCDDKYE